MIPERSGIIVWVNHLKSVKVLDKFGTVHYVSKKLKYVAMYVNKDKLDQTCRTLQNLNFVKNIELSHRDEIRTDYNSKHQDKTRFYTL